MRRKEIKSFKIECSTGDCNELSRSQEHICTECFDKFLEHLKAEGSSFDEVVALGMVEMGAPGVFSVCYLSKE